MEGGMSIDMWLNTASTASESKEVTQEDMVRVSESMKKAANIGQQIKWDSQKNALIAKFLEYLFAEVKNDTVWEIVIAICSKPDHTWFGMVLAIHELILLYAPFFATEFEHSWVKHAFEHEIPEVHPIWLDQYISYVRSIRQHYPLFQQVDQGTLASLILALIEYFGYGRVDADKKDELLASVVVKLQ